MTLVKSSVRYFYVFCIDATPTEIIPSTKPGVTRWAGAVLFRLLSWRVVDSDPLDIVQPEVPCASVSKNHYLI
jgi:hypothetical protein